MYFVLTSEHFVGNHSQVPPIHRRPVSLSVQDLWGQVLGRAAQRVGTLRRVMHSFFGQAEVHQLNMSLAIQKNVLGFQISIDYIVRVQLFQGQGDLRRVEAGGGLIEFLHPREMIEEFPTGRVVEHEVELVLRLEGVVKAHDERVVDGAQHAALGFRMLYLFALYDICFGQHFHCVHLIVRLLPH